MYWAPKLEALKYNRDIKFSKSQNNCKIQYVQSN